MIMKRIVLQSILTNKLRNTYFTIGVKYIVFINKYFYIFIESNSQISKPV